MVSLVPFINGKKMLRKGIIMKELNLPVKSQGEIDTLYAKLENEELKSKLVCNLHLFIILIINQ